MSKVKKLLQAYNNFISIPWREGAAAEQRVIFCIYNESDELRVRARIEEFEIATRDAGHLWGLFDLTDTFAEWLANQKYAKSYFKQPDRLATIYDKYQDLIVDQFREKLSQEMDDQNTVVALSGVGSLFGFIKVKDLVSRLAPMVKGRLLVFFPGSYENNNYRLLDGYDGWNYLAVPLTANRD